MSRKLQIVPFGWDIGHKMGTMEKEDKEVKKQVGSICIGSWMSGKSIDFTSKQLRGFYFWIAVFIFIQF